MKKTVFIISAILFSGTLYAQDLKVKSGRMWNSATGTSNEGVVCGYERYRSPYVLWNTKTDEITEIGSMGAGEGVGGSARFSADGRFLSGTFTAPTSLPQGWECHLLGTPVPMKRLLSNEGGCRIFVSGAGVAPFLVNGSRMDQVWTIGSDFTVDGEDIPQVVDLCQPSSSDLFAIAGDKLLYSRDGNYFRLLATAPEGLVAYKKIYFTIPRHGIVFAETESGAKMFYTQDYVASWKESANYEGTPLFITHWADNCYAVINADGALMKSTDGGINWEKTTPANFPAVDKIEAVKFVSEEKGVVIAENCVYTTADGGAEWSKVDLEVALKDVVYLSETELYAVGARETIVHSTDGGATWTTENSKAGATANTLNSIAITSKWIVACGQNSTIYRKNLLESADVLQMARYDVEAGTWNALGNFGFVSDESTGSGHNISANGKNVVGLSYVAPDCNKLYDSSARINNNHAALWREDEGLIDLGSMVENRGSRANACDEDANVVVGWQELEKGEWPAVKWERDANGTYTESYILKDNEKEFGPDNMVLYASAVSTNGQWIGGGMVSTGTNAWLWSEKDGAVDLGKEGFVNYISNDGDYVVGNTFFWTSKDGSKTLSEYLTETLGMELGTFIPKAITSVSPSGQYISGHGSSNNVGVTYCLDTKNPATGIDLVAVDGDDKCLNVTCNRGKVNVKFNAEGAAVHLYDMSGRQVATANIAQGEANISTIGLPEGVYVVRAACAGNVNVVSKVVVK